MRNTNINSTIAKASVRFANAGYDVVALLPAVLQRLQCLSSGQPDYSTAILAGNSGAAFQSRLLTSGERHPSETIFGRVMDSMYLPSISDRDWQTPGTTSRQTGLGKS